MYNMWSISVKGPLTALRFFGYIICGTVSNEQVTCILVADAKCEIFPVHSNLNSLPRSYLGAIATSHFLVHVIHNYYELPVIPHSGARRKAWKECATATTLSLLHFIYLFSKDHNSRGRDKYLFVIAFGWASTFGVWSDTTLQDVRFSTCCSVMLMAVKRRMTMRVLLPPPQKKKKKSRLSACSSCA